MGRRKSNKAGKLPLLALIAAAFISGGLLSYAVTAAGAPNPGHSWNQVECNDALCVGAGQVSIGDETPTGSDYTLAIKQKSGSSNVLAVRDLADRQPLIISYQGLVKTTGHFEVDTSGTGSNWYSSYYGAWVTIDNPEPKKVELTDRAEGRSFVWFYDGINGLGKVGTGKTGDMFSATYPVADKSLQIEGKNGVYIGANNVPVITITPTGRVGIGTTDPQTDFQVVGNFIQIPKDNTDKGVTQCDEATEMGRIYVHTPTTGYSSLYVCARTNGIIGWKSISLL